VENGKSPGHWLGDKVSSRLTVQCPLAGSARADFNLSCYVHENLQQLLYFVQLSSDAAVNAGRDKKKARALRFMVMQSINTFLGE